MADTLEFSEVGFPRDRFTDELIAEIQKYAPSQLEISDRDGDGTTEVILKHCYIERRMIPLNIYLQEAFDTLQMPGADDIVRQRAREQIHRDIAEIVAELLKTQSNRSMRKSVPRWWMKCWTSCWALARWSRC